MSVAQLEGERQAGSQVSTLWPVPGGNVAMGCGEQLAPPLKFVPLQNSPILLWTRRAPGFVVRHLSPQLLWSMVSGEDGAIVEGSVSGARFKVKGFTRRFWKDSISDKAEAVRGRL